MRPIKTHKGVKIYKVAQFIVGSDLKELKDDSLKYCKPQFDFYYMYASGGLCDTKQECINDIEDLFNKCEFNNEYTIKDFNEIMNNPIESLDQYYSTEDIKNWKGNEQYKILS